MFERYTERARRVLFFARYEASQLGSPSIETEHMLLGLIREGKGLTSRLFARAHISLADIRQEVERRVVFQERAPVSTEIPFSAEVHRALQDTLEEADRLGHAYIGTEHLLLGLLREEQSVAATILLERGMRLEHVRAGIRELLDARPGSDEAHVINEAFLAGRARTPIVLRPHVVLVQLTVRAELLEEFQAALLHNARESLAKDHGCLRFDVSQHADNLQQWVLHEVYTDAAAHAVHRQSPHFLAYDEVAKKAVIEKSVVTAVGRHLT